MMPGKSAMMREIYAPNAHVIACISAFASARLMTAFFWICRSRALRSQSSEINSSRFNRRRSADDVDGAFSLLASHLSASVTSRGSPARCNARTCCKLRFEALAMASSAMVFDVFDLNFGGFYG